ncbi:uncharacterized protein [Montipora foliosa]|uniref:uncharacterized protein n=1 Tax=Montipora foliosa TaxID=591990 RepID=UPI0035F2057E
MRKLSIEDVSSCELHFQNLNQTEKRNYVIEYLSNHCQSCDSGEFITEFFAKGKSICREAWLLIHNVNREWFRRIFNKFKEGTVEVEHGNLGQKKPSQKTTDCIAWLQFFVSCVGQYQPDNKTIHLPSCFTRLSIYQRMCEENTSFNAPSVGISQFYSIFRGHFSHVLIPKENRFTKCTDCTRYKEAKEKMHDKKARNEIEKLLNEHMELVWKERRVYYLHRYKARRYPNKYLTVIDDAMDQKTTCIPRLRRKTKATCNLSTVGTHLVGAIFHSGQSPNGKEVFGSFDYYQWPHDPNLTGSVLLTMLSLWCERYQLPPVLYLQLDNCVKENKNQYVLWLLALLVELEIFEKIRLNFLPVGHTHEDIDAFFGVYSKHLTQMDVYTVEGLLEAMKNCLQVIKVFPFLLEVVFDIKEWLAPFSEELHSHTQPKCFKFVRSEQGKCVMFYRNYSHMQWEGPQQLLKSVPTGKPGLVQPSLHKIDAASLKRDLKKFEENYSERVSQVWAQWLQDLDKLLELPTEWVWPLEVLENCKKIRPSNEDVAVPSTLQAMRDKETEATEQIYTGRYRPPTERENPVLASDDFLDRIEVGSFVAVNLSNYDKIPVIGKVLQINNDTVKIHYWKGSFKGKFSPQNLPRSRTPWVDELPKSCIILCSFSLTDGDRLLPSSRKHLQSEYAKLKNIQ